MEATGGSKGYTCRDMHHTQPTIALGEAVPRRAPATVAHQQPILDQGCKEGSERVRACVDFASRVAGGDVVNESPLQISSGKPGAVHCKIVGLSLST